MDTRFCDGVNALAGGVDLLIIESTFLDEDVQLATMYGHLTAGQAGRVAADAGARLLVLTHFSERYRVEDEHRFLEPAAAVYDGEIKLVHDLDRIAMPRRRRDAAPSRGQIIGHG